MHWQFFVYFMKCKFTNVCWNLNLKCFPTEVILTFVPLSPCQQAGPGECVATLDNCKLLSSDWIVWSAATKLQTFFIHLSSVLFIKNFSLFSWNFFPTWTRSDLVVFPLFNHQKFSYHWFKSRLISVWAQPGLTAAAHKEAFDVALLFPFHLRAARAKVQSGENERLYGLFLRPSPIRDHTSRFTAKDPLEDHAQS